jgi:hypothetical protein
MSYQNFQTLFCLFFIFPTFPQLCLKPTEKHSQTGQLAGFGSNRFGNQIFNKKIASFTGFWSKWESWSPPITRAPTIRWVPLLDMDAPFLTPSSTFSMP